MDPERTLRRMCRRHGLTYASMQRLLPLVRRAARASDEVRASLLEVVEAALAREAAERAQRAQLERQWLLAVANVLHRWPDDKS